MVAQLGTHIPTLDSRGNSGSYRNRHRSRGYARVFVRDPGKTWKAVAEPSGEIRFALRRQDFTMNRAILRGNSPSEWILESFAALTGEPGISANRFTFRSYGRHLHNL